AEGTPRGEPVRERQRHAGAGDARGWSRRRAGAVRVPAGAGGGRAPVRGGRARFEVRARALRVVLERGREPGLPARAVSARLNGTLRGGSSSPGRARPSQG